MDIMMAGLNSRMNGKQITDGQTNLKEGKESDRQTESRRIRQTERETDKYRDKQIYRFIEI